MKEAIPGNEAIVIVNMYILVYELHHATRIVTACVAFSQVFLPIATANQHER